MRRVPDVLVIGGGVIGCAVARAIAGSDRSVLLVDRGPFGGEASSAAAGVLAVASGSEREGPRLEERRASLAGFPALAAELEDETGIDVEFDPSGVLELCLDARDEEAQADRFALRVGQGFRVERLDARGLHAVEPSANPATRGALLFPDDAQVASARLVAALARSAERRGAQLVRDTEVHHAEGTADRILAVHVGGERVTPATVVLAAGAWATRIPGLTVDLGIVPVRGQMLAVRPARPLCRRILSHGDGYVVPKRDGELLVGATMERVGFEKAVTAAGLRALLAHLERLAPAALDAPVVRTWSGLRPHAPDGPVVGRAAGVENLLLACGHYRNGILLAPTTAEAVRAMVEG